MIIHATRQAVDKAGHKFVMQADLVNAFNHADRACGDPCANPYRTLIIFIVENRSKDGEPACCQKGRCHRD